MAPCDATGDLTASSTAEYSSAAILRAVLLLMATCSVQVEDMSNLSNIRLNIHMDPFCEVDQQAHAM
jgi:hypothetical protein